MEENPAEPREYDVDMFTVACTDAVLESLEELQLKVEEIQLSCEEYATRNGELQQRLIDKENELVMTRGKLEEQVAHLKKINLQILSQKFMKDNNIQKWVKLATDIVEKEQDVHDFEAKVDQLSIKCMEKDKLIASLEWQLKDKETSLSTMTADRNRLAAEVDELAIRLDELEFVEALQRQESVRSRPDVPSYDSDDEPMSSKRNSARLSNHLASDDDDGSVRLRRAANFSNINSLNLSSDFSIEKLVASESPCNLGQGDLSKSDNMLSKDICKSLNRIYELREDSKYISRSNNCIDRQSRLRSSLTERRLTSVEPSDIVNIQMKAAEDRKPRLYINGDYCEEMRAPLPSKIWSSPALRRKDRARNKGWNISSSEPTGQQQYSGKYVRDTTLNRENSDPNTKTELENSNTSENNDVQKLSKRCSEDGEKDVKPELQISLC